jgi:hypothetical protein
MPIKPGKTGYVFNETDTFHRLYCPMVEESRKEGTLKTSATLQNYDPNTHTTCEECVEPPKIIFDLTLRQTAVLMLLIVLLYFVSFLISHYWRMFS